MRFLSHFIFLIFFISLTISFPSLNATQRRIRNGNGNGGIVNVNIAIDVDSDGNGDRRSHSAQHTNPHVHHVTPIAKSHSKIHSSSPSPLPPPLSTHSSPSISSSLSSTDAYTSASTSTSTTSAAFLDMVFSPSLNDIIGAINEIDEKSKIPSPSTSTVSPPSSSLPLPPSSSANDVHPLPITSPSSSPSHSVATHFIDWMSTHKKKYTRRQFHPKLSVWYSQYKKINSHNDKVNKENGKSKGNDSKSFQMQLYSWSDLSHDEFLKRYGGFNMEKKDIQIEQQTNTHSQHLSSVPSSARHLLSASSYIPPYSSSSSSSSREPFSHLNSNDNENSKLLDGDQPILDGTRFTDPHKFNYVMRNPNNNNNYGNGNGNSEVQPFDYKNYLYNNNFDGFPNNLLKNTDFLGPYRYPDQDQNLGNGNDNGNGNGNGNLNQDYGPFLLPQTYNWHEINNKTYQSPIRTQSLCASCWAIASSEVMETRYAINHKSPVIPLSPQQLIDCVSTVPELPHSYCHGCTSGIPAVAFIWAESHTLYNDEGYSYVDKEENCKSEEEMGRMSGGREERSEAKVLKVRKIVGGEKEIMREIASKGPVMAAISLSDAVKHYRSGVLVDDDCNQNPLEHAVVIIGYGYDDDANLPYWIIQQSWGESYGENGYLRLVRGKNECKIDTYVYAADMN